ncbi:hypothetical protein PRZ48_002102 [Zasmidium cellare]|uniref:Uncharacterized protein n=1 Tax=Zasmidium cellare TaxID=395010 RepID=A0ABR0F453_ZASCE|nr:hypothetical protein PRZ48_002102 [Zasmidium cellare]
MAAIKQEKVDAGETHQAALQAGEPTPARIPLRLRVTEGLTLRLNTARPRDFTNLEALHRANLIRGPMIRIGRETMLAVRAERATSERERRYLNRELRKLRAQNN